MGVGVPCQHPLSFQPRWRPRLIWRVATTSVPGDFEAAYPHHPSDPRLHLSRASIHPSPSQTATLGRAVLRGKLEGGDLLV